MHNLFFDGVDDSIVKREKSKAREMRKTGWWQKKTAAGECYYCRSKVPPKSLTMDHIVPLGRGGLSTKGNIVPACKECNTKKKTMLPLEWEEYMNQLNNGCPPTTESTT